MTNAKPADIYTFSFEVLDETRLADCVVAPEEVVVVREARIMEDAPTIAIVEEIGCTALSSESVAQAEDAVLLPSHIEDVTAVEVATPTYAENRYPVPSEEAILLASVTIDRLLQNASRGIVTLTEISTLAYHGQRVSKSAHRDFINAVNQDLRLKHTEGGDYQVMVDSEGLLIDPGSIEEQVVSPTKISWLADEVVSTLLAQAPYPKLSPKQLLGTAKSLGMFLTSDEVHEFFAKVATDSRLLPLPDGSFSIPEATLEDSSQIKSQATTVLTREELKKERQREATVEQRKMADTGKKAKADTRHRRKRSPRKRLQGRAHNQSKTLDQLIAEMNNPKPNGQAKP